MIDIIDRDLPGWEIPENVSHQSLYNFLECVMEIAHAFQGLVSDWEPGTTAVVFVQGPLMVSAARRISTSVRKIMLDGNRSLLKRCVVKPDIHPFKAPHVVPTMNFLRRFEEQRMTLGWADGISREITVPSFEHTTTIAPLLGLRHIAGTKFCMYNPFDHGAEPIKFQKWMSSQVIEIDGIQFNAEQLLRDMANKEGAHIEENFSLITPEDLTFDRDKNTLHRLVNGVRFGGLTYLQIFSIYTGLYIVNNTRPMLENLPFPKGTESVTFMCEAISRSPRSLSTKEGDIEFFSHPIAVLDHDRNLRGNFEVGVRSTFRVPDKHSGPNS